MLKGRAFQVKVFKSRLYWLQYSCSLEFPPEMKILSLPRIAQLKFPLFRGSSPLHYTFSMRMFISSSLFSIYSIFRPVFYFFRIFSAILNLVHTRFLKFLRSYSNLFLLYPSCRVEYEHFFIILVGSKVKFWFSKYLDSLRVISRICEVSDPLYRLVSILFSYSEWQNL